MSKEKADIIKASDIIPKEIKWLWYPYIPYGKITLVQGDPGDGKSKFMLAIAALLTRGMPLPFREEWSEPINVIYQTTEDDSDDTVVPRFINAGGDTTRLLFINEKDKALTFDDERIEDAIRETGAKLVILDPLSSYIRDISLNMANEVRSRFNPLIRAAKETGCAIVIVAHLNKMGGTKAIYRSNGSIDIVGATRSALLIARTDKDNPQERIMAVQKSNLAPIGNAIIFNVNESVEFIGETNKTADEILGNIYSSGGKDDKLTLAKEILTKILRNEPVPQTQIMDKMKASGIGERTARKAKADIGAMSVKKGSIWFWSLK